MNTSIITIIIFTTFLLIIAFLIWKLTSRKSNFIELDLPEITLEELKKLADEAEEEKCEEIIESSKDEKETFTKPESDEQGCVLVISDTELKAINKKIDDNLKTTGLDPVSGCYIPAELRNDKANIKPIKNVKNNIDNSKTKKKKTNKTVREQTSTKKKLEKHPEKANKIVKNNKTKSDIVINSKKNKKKTNKK